MKYLLVFGFRIVNDDNPADFSEKSWEKEVECEPDQLNKKISHYKSRLEINAEKIMEHNCHIDVWLKQVVAL